MLLITNYLSHSSTAIWANKYQDLHEVTESLPDLLYSLYYSQNQDLIEVMEVC